MVKFGEIDSADTRAGKFLLASMGGWAECPACADTGDQGQIRIQVRQVCVENVRKIRLENINRKKWKIPFNWQSKHRNLIILVKTKTPLVLGMPLFLLSCPLVFGVPKWKLRVSLLSWICCLSLTITLLPRRKTLAKPSYVLLVVI